MVLKDIMPRGVTLVFVGRAAGNGSARRGHYYADPSNSFWDDLSQSGLTLIRLSPDQDVELPRCGIGSTVPLSLTHTSADPRPPSLGGQVSKMVCRGWSLV